MRQPRPTRPAETTTFPSNKRGETKMIDVVRSINQIDEYNAAESVADDVLIEVTAIVTGEKPRARVRTFIAKPCSLCASVREQDKTINKADNFTRVFATRGNIRYCRCHYCGNTWKDSDSVPHNGS